MPRLTDSFAERLSEIERWRHMEEEYNKIVVGAKSLTYGTTVFGMPNKIFKTFREELQAETDEWLGLKD